jgi:tetrahydromethanopterin S-methyltransferase subunit E
LVSRKIELEQLLAIVLAANVTAAQKVKTTFKASTIIGRIG